MRPFDASGTFIAGPKSDVLRRAAVQSASITVFNQVAIFAIQMVATIVVARLVTPSDFGLVTMITTFSILIASCGQVGFPEVVMQRVELSHRLASNLFWINIATSAVLSCAFAAAAPLLAAFYHDQRVAAATLGVASSIFLYNVPVLHIGLMRRAMRFSALTSNDVVARAISVGVALFLASRGYGYWALVASTVALPLATCVGVLMLCHWVPGPPRKVPGTRDAVVFAGHVFARFSFSYFTRNTDNLLVGWRFGALSMGLYKKAYDLFALSSNQLLSVFPVAVSTLSRLTKSPEQYRRYFLGGLAILALVGMGAGGELGLVGPDLVSLLLGPRWIAAGQILAYFAPGIGVMLIYGVHGMIHLSIGTPERWFRWGLVEFAVTVSLFLLALRWGPVGIACAWTISFWILIVPAFWYAGKPIGFSFLPILNLVWRYFAASAVAEYICAHPIHHWLMSVFYSGLIAVPVRIALQAVTFAVLYIVLAIGLHGSFEPISQIGRLLPELLPRSRFPRYAQASEPIAK